MDGDGALPLRSLTVREMLEERFLQCHMDTLRLHISLSRLHEQREWFRHANPGHESPDEKNDRDEFEMELHNLHALLTTPNLHLDTEIFKTAQASIRQYLALWPGAETAIDRWWTPRTDKHAAVHADLQLVIPGVWIGSSVTLKPEHAELLVQKKIRHVIHCTTTAVDVDDDFARGAARAQSQVCGKTARDFPMIDTSTQDDEDSTTAMRHHRITLFQLGRMEFLVRRRDKKIPPCVSSHAIHKIVSGLLQPLLQRLTNDQYGRDVCLVESQITYVDQFNSLLLYCDSGTSASIVVATALVMAQLHVSYDIALRLITCARRYVAPSEFFEHVLRAFESSLLITTKNDNSI